MINQCKLTSYLFNKKAANNTELRFYIYIALDYRIQLLLLLL